MPGRFLHSTGGSVRVNNNRTDPRIGGPSAGASGKTFGFVYSGLDFGGAIGPIAFGWLMDGGHHRWVFLGTALLFAIAVFTVLQLSKGSRQ